MTSLTYSVAEEMNPSKRSTMEDAHMIQSDLATVQDGDTTKTYSLLAVYDGHGGRDICDYLHTTFHEIVKQELLVADGTSIEERIERSFLIADISSHTAGIRTSGATVALCLLEKQLVDNRCVCKAIHAANVGDARIVYSSSGEAVRLTCDHLADDPVEKRRIEQAGGFVMRDRVLGILAIARSLGDHGLKQFVIAKPHVTTTKIDEPQDEGRVENFAIIACDGLWDVFKDQEAVDFVQGMQQGKLVREDTAQQLCAEALKRGSTDNITVIVTWL